MGINRKTILLVVSSVLLSLGVTLNSLCLESQVLGILLTVVFLAAEGVICGNLFFNGDPTLLKGVKGSFVFIIFLTIPETFLLLLDMFSLVFSMLLLAPMTTLFGVLLLLRRKNLGSSVQAKESKSFFQGWKSRLLLSCLVVVFGLVSFYMLWDSRTTEPMFDVWQTIPTTFFFLVGSSIFFLVYLLLSKRNSSLQLVLIIFLGFLFVSVYYLVWYPSLYGDPLSNLGTARFALNTGRITARDYVISQGFWLDLIKGREYSSFIVMITRMASSDIYWVHNIVVPLLWAIITPISLYEVTCLLVNRPLREYPKTAVLAAFSGSLLVPLLVMWGAAPTPNTLAFIFLFFCLSQLLHWSETGERRLLVLVMATLAVTLLTHPFPGIIMGVFLLITLVFRFVRYRPLCVALIFTSVIIYPVALAYQGGFSIEKMFVWQSFLEFERSILTIPLFMACLGFFFFLRLKDTNRRIGIVMSVMWLAVLFGYYVTKFGVLNLQFGSGRILTIADFLLTPFFSLGLSLLVVSISRITRLHHKNTIPKEFIGFSSLRSLAVVILCMIITLQSLATLYQVYPVGETGLAPTEYEAEAIYYINSTALRPFAVVSDTLFTNLAIGLLGEGYSYTGQESGGAFGVPDWSYYLQYTYLKMTENPSLLLLKGVQTDLNVTYVYFVLSVRLATFSTILPKMLELLKPEKSFGNEQLYVFKYLPVLFEGNGPMVSVNVDNGTTVEVQSRYRYEEKEEVTYGMNMTGHTSYNITNYPRYWVFRSLRVNERTSRFDDSSDVNFFIAKSGLNVSDVLEVKWFANDLYTKTGWKDDSFKNGWGSYPIYSYPISPDIASDGNVLTFSWSFTPGKSENYYYAKPLNISTDDYSNVIVRWKSSARIAVVGLYFDVGFRAIVPFGSQSDYWTTTIEELPAGRNITYVMVGIADYGYLAASIATSLYVDYILLVSKS